MLPYPCGVPSSAQNIQPGPAGWENWQAYERGLPAQGAYEVALYTDSRIVAEIEGLGPYSLLNTVPATWKAEAGRAELAVVLRVDVHDDQEHDFRRDDWEQLELGSYHGGTLGDELAALTAVALGIRLRAGGTTRRFGLIEDDPRGKPAEFEHRRPSLVPPRRDQPSVLPAIAVDGARLDDALPLLESYPRLKSADAAALVRAARLYEQGIWNADADPGIAWLELVSAIEVAAVYWRDYQKPDLLDRLRLNAPKLADVLRDVDEEVVRNVAREVVHLLRATDRFVQFLLTFLADPPEPRPSHGLDWTQLRHSFLAVYERRSEALHGGAPIPWAMTMSPRRNENGSYEERIGGLGSWSGGAYWPSSATPMYLNTFAHIVRGALIAWWRSMVPSVPLS